MATLEQIKQMKQEPWPTAPVGWNVNWFEANESDRCYAAIVTKVEGPAKVALAVLKPNSMIVHKMGVLHRSHPVHRNKHATETMRNGAWDYLPGTNPLKSHRDVHLKDLEKREFGILEQQRLAEAAKTEPRVV